MVIELVTLRVKPTVSDAELARAAGAAMLFLSSCRGFVRRRLAKSETGDWVDYVEWETREDALAAAEQFNHVPQTRAFNEAVELGSVVVRHLIVYSSAN
jgi:hypothetical protein